VNMPRRVKSLENGRTIAIKRMALGDQMLDRIVALLSSGEDCESLTIEVTKSLCHFLRIIDCKVSGLKLTDEELWQAAMDDAQILIESRTSNLSEASYYPDGDY